MQLVGATKTTTVKNRKKKEDHKNSGLQSLVRKHPLAALGSGRGEGVPTVVESDICDMCTSAPGDGGYQRRRERTQRPATVHVILEFGCAEGVVRQSCMKE